MTPLCEMSLRYGSDKCDYHHYTEHYHSFFKDRRNEVKKVLEIGIGDPSSMQRIPGWRHLPYEPGCSLRMWAEYFPNAEIYALDNNTSLLINQGRIHSFYCNQGDENSLKSAMENIGRDFDLIVDDGSHVPAHQALTARMLVPLLPSNGIYVIEDVWPFPCTVGWSDAPFGLDQRDIPYPSELIACSAQRNCDDHLVVIRA